jgi:hypothetical protein
MRFIAALLGCVAVALTVAGCNPTDKHYFTQGIGTALYPEDVAAQTDLQNAYVADICRQAGLQPTQLDGVASCGPDPYSPKTWWLFVQAGMNDIDQRCDAYLTWLDNVRRSRVPILNQIAQTGAITGDVLAAAGVHSVPIAIVGSAFGLASDTFTNVNSRLLTEVNHSTVQAVVLSKQKEYRDQLQGTTDNKPVAIVSKPTAMYALRSYLRLCMPMTIETEINNTVSVIARGGTEALNNKDPLISAKSVGVATITDVNKPLPAGPKPSAPPPDRRGPNEGPLPVSAIKGYQRALCVTPPDGKLGPQTRAAISEYLKMHNELDTSAEFDRRTPGLLQDAVDSIGDCRGKFLANVYEAVNYGAVNDAAREKRIKSLQMNLNNALKANGSKTVIDVNGKFTDDSNQGDKTRSAIAEVRRLLHPNDTVAQDTKNLKNRELDGAFEDEISP